MVRSMHEANRLLDAFLDEDEGMILSRWLNDEQVRPEDARKTTNDTSLRDLERIKAAGVEITPIDILGVSQEIYRVLSSGAHNQRSSVYLDYSPALRRYSYTLDDVREVAGHAVGVAAVVEEAVIAVSKALWHFVPGFEFSRDVKPQIDTLHRLRADVERNLR